MVGEEVGEEGGHMRAVLLTGGAESESERATSSDNERKCVLLYGVSPLVWVGF